MRDFVRLQSIALRVTLLVGTLWLIHALIALLGLNPAPLALRPGEPASLTAIVTAPMVHGSWQHLFSNSLTLLVLGTAMFYGFPQAARVTLPLIWLLSGLLVWLFARDALHLGASGIAYGMMFFVFVIGILRRDRASVGLVLLVFFLHGSMLWGVLPQGPGISWEYHLYGALVGTVCAVLWRYRDPLPATRLFEYDDMPPVGDDEHALDELWRRDPADDPEPEFRDMWRYDPKDDQRRH